MCAVSLLVEACTFPELMRTADQGGIFNHFVHAVKGEDRVSDLVTGVVPLLVVCSSKRLVAWEERDLSRALLL